MPPTFSIVNSYGKEKIMSNPQKVTDEKWVNLFKDESGYMYASRGQDGLPTDKPDAVCIIGVTEDESTGSLNIICIKQYRPSVQLEELSLPAGLIEDGETPLETAKRELLEETGYEFILDGDNQYNPLITPAMTTSSGISNEKICFVVGAVKKSKSHHDIDPNEKISEVLVLPVDVIMNSLPKHNMTVTMFTALFIVKTMQLANQLLPH